MSDLPKGWIERSSKSKPGLKYYYNVTTGVTQWDRPNEVAPVDEVRASHILVKHAKSRRPASWKDPEITRSVEEAEEIVRRFEASIRRGEQSFEEIAQRESDCSSHAKNGDLGKFGRGKMQKKFEDAAFSLNIGEMSSLVYSDSGIHLIKRTA